MLYPLSCGARDPINRGVLPSLANAENEIGVINLWASVRRQQPHLCTIGELFGLIKGIVGF